MIKILSGLLTVLSIFFAGEKADAAWLQESFFADYPVIREYQVYENRPFQRAEIQVLNGAMQVQRADMLTDGGYWSLWGLEGDYYTQQYRWMTFPGTYIRTIRLRVQSLQPGQPVTLRVQLL